MNGVLVISLALCQFFYPGISNKRYVQQKACMVYYNTCIRNKFNEQTLQNLKTEDVIVTQCIMESKNE